MPSKSPNGNPSGSKHAAHDHSLSRLSPGHSGLDPVESYREMSFFEGKFLRRLLTGQLKTRNPLYLILLFFGSLLFPLGLFLGLLTLQQPDPSGFFTAQFWLAEVLGALPMIALGLASLATFTNNMESIRRSGSRKQKRKRGV